MDLHDTARALVAGGLAAVMMSGCTTVPPMRGTTEIDALITARGAPPPSWPGTASAPDDEAARVAELAGAELTIERAVELAFLRNARIRELYAELGLAHAEVLEANRLRGPTLGYADLAAEGGGAQITRSISLDFADVLLLPARRRFGVANIEAGRARTAAALLDLQVQVETAWFAYVAATQTAEMRTEAARAAEHAAEYARRLRDAGNISARAVALELAAAGEARIAAARERAEAIRARAALAGLLGIRTREAWRVPARLSAPLPADPRASELMEQALDARLDVSAARREVAALEGAVTLARRWRWLGEVEVGYERESESDGQRLRGPTLSVGLPLLDWNRGGVLRAQAQLEGARARLTALELAVRNDTASGLDALVSAREIADAYRTALIPQREAVVERTQEEVNYMLTGAFELLQAKRAQLDAYEEYVAAVRDYWIARVELRRAAGGRLPDDDAPRPPESIGLEEVPGPGRRNTEGESR